MTYFFEENILYDCTISNFKNNKIIFKYSFFVKVSYWKIVSTISVTENLISRVGNRKAVKNIFFEKISNNLWKFNHFYKNWYFL